MSIDVDPDWWKELFDEIYLMTDARSVCNDSVTRREVDFICELLPIASGHHILDLCGGHGRHSLEFCRRGYSHCTLLDYSNVLIERAKTAAVRSNYSLTCLQADARNTGLPPESFDHVLILGNSMGYIQAPDADGKLASEAFRVLRPGGWLMVDVADGAAVTKTYHPVAWHEVDENMVVCRQRELRDGAICAREMVLSKQTGLVRDKTYAITLFDPASLTHLFKESGFRRVEVHTDFSPQRAEGDYGFMNHRMIAMGRKP